MDTKSDSKRRLSDDASAILLLSGHLADRQRSGANPLTINEYNSLAEALRRRDLRPSSLFQIDAATITGLLEDLPANVRKRVSAERVQRLMDRGGQLAIAASRWSSAGIWIVTRADAAYPSRYKQKLKQSAPPIVFGIGPQAGMELGGIAVVGSRQPDPDSENYSRLVGRWAAESKTQIVSGAASGVDEVSMLSCAEAGGIALGVVAESLLRLSTRRGFRDQIVSGRLALVSSYDPDAGFSVPSAMGRNRWIYALSDRALVVACTEGHGGTWAGAIEALKSGVTVFVKTGNDSRPGNDALLHYGALPAPLNLSEMLVSPSNGQREEISRFADEAIFDAAQPIILTFLRRAATAKEVSSALDLTPSQTKVWLSKLADGGRIIKTGTRFRTRSEGEPSQVPGRQIELIAPN